MKRLLVFMLVFAMAVSLPGCTASHAQELSADFQPSHAAEDYDLDSDSAAVTDFSVRLFQRSMTAGKNTLISPVSVLYALSMTANGADGQTLSQMEQALGLPVGTLNAYLHSYMAQLPKDDTLHLANSIWFKDDPQLTVADAFLQANADYYGADIFKAPFDDATCKQINRWVEDNTDGMIKDILDQIPEGVVMYLVNALSFDAKWQDKYDSSQLRDGKFTTEDGQKREVELMYSEEDRYLQDGNATGFIKYYENGTYAFAALLPNEGICVEEYVNGLTGEKLHAMLSSPEDVKVHVLLPGFESGYMTEMSGILQQMGMTDAFDPAAADFSRMASADGNICISRVIHKTVITVDANGTKAAAATVSEATAAGSPQMEEVKTVRLDRPFVYMIIDCENNIPIFMGTMMDTALGKA